MLKDVSYLRMGPLDSPHEAFNTGIAVPEAVVFLEVLPDALGPKAFGYGLLDLFAVRLSSTAGGRPGWF
jgi:hypothetical protein